MRYRRLTGLVLKRVNIGEADKLITIFTRENGKLAFIGKGIRRIKSRRSAHLELFNLVEFQSHVSGSSKVIPGIGESRLVDSFANIKKVTTGSAYLFYLMEMLDKLIPDGEPHEEIFDFLTRNLKILDSRNPKEDVSQNQIKHICFSLLWELGYLPKNTYPKIGLTSFIEQIAERPMRSRPFIVKIKA